MHRIVIDARGLGGSSGRYVERLIHYLQKIDRKNNYKILLSPKDYPNWSPTANNFEKILSPHKEYTLEEQIGLKKQIESMKPDLVHFSMVQQPVWYNQSPVVTTMHDLTTVRFNNPDKNPFVFWFKQQVYKWVNKKVAKKSTEIIAISKFVKQDIMNFCKINPEKITITYESADEIARNSQPIEALKNKDFIMYVGRPTPHKNLKRLIDAFRKLQTKHPNLILALAGKKDGNYNRHEKYVNEHVVKNVYFTDFIPDEQLRWMYEKTLVYCFPSLSEGFGLPGLEAMRHGAPVASSNATSLPEIYGDAAHYFNPNSTDDIARAIDDVLTKQALRSELVAAGYQNLERFSWERMAHETLAVYERALEKTTRP